MSILTTTSATQAITQLALRLTADDKEPIRGMKTPDGRSIFSVYDAMWNTGAYVSRDAVKSAWKRLMQSEFKEEVGRMTTYFQFSGQGQRETPCVDFQGIQRVFALVGGTIGAEYRRLSELTLTRLIAGDLTLVEEVHENAASDAPVNVLAREALEHPTIAAPEPAIEPQTAIEPEEPMTTDLALMRPEYRSTYLADLAVAVPLLERRGAAAMADADAEYRRAEARALIFRSEADAASIKAAASVNEAEALARRQSVNRQNDELATAKQAAQERRKRKALEEAAELDDAIKRFVAASPADRAIRRYAFAAQIEPWFPAKRTRDSFVAKLVKAPVLVPATKAGVYVLRLEDGTYYVGESQDTDVRVAQHLAGEGASVTVGKDAVRVSPYTAPIPGHLEAWERAETLERMFRHGIEKVRGWMFTTPVMSPDQRESAFEQICVYKKLCTTCGRGGHFAASCFANSKAQWSLS